ncbi:MAG: methyltransferase domain-containing protein [bacterium]|nr:methyltransferase domain-containing protein [bacterium]
MEKTLGLIQAHARGWDGALDHSLIEVEGMPAVQRTIERLLETEGLVASQCCLAVPDEGVNDAFLPVAEATGVTLFRGSTNDVALRLLQAADHFGASRILHVMGQHMFLIPELLERLVAIQDEGSFDLVQAPINFETHFTGIAVRVDALRRAREEILARPEDERLRLLVRPLSYVFDRTDRFRSFVLAPEALPRYSDDELRRFRGLAEAMFVGTERSVSDTARAYQPGNYCAQRYVHVEKALLPTDVVLDAACGDGSGSERLARTVRRVVGVDLDEDVIATNRRERTSDRDNLTFERADVCRLPFPDDAFTAIVSLETIEHVEDAEAYCRELRRVLAPGGRLFCSTPQNLFGAIPINPWHLREYSVAEFRAILERHFDRVEIRGAVNGLLTEGEVGNNMIATAVRPAPARRARPAAGVVPPIG